MTFKNDFEGYSQEEVLDEFKASDEAKALVDTIIFADYTYVDYSGSAHVVYIGKDGLLYEVHGGHCSCHGLEDQWEPEQTSYEYYAERMSRDLIDDPDMLTAVSAYQLGEGRDLSTVRIL